MKVWLTGGTGMVGRNILEHSFWNNHDVSSPSREELDLLDFNEVNNWVKINKPDFVIHAAGIVGGIEANINDPIKFYLENLDLGRNVIWASKLNNVKNLLNLGSSCMYPRFAENPLNEDMILTGQLEPTNEGYALAKIMAYKLCEYISKDSNNFQYKTLIPCNIYGRYDHFDPIKSHLIPAVIQKIHLAKVGNLKSVEIWGDGLARREFMYAGDLADAICQAVDSFQTLPNCMNIGLGEDYSITNYYHTIAKAIGYKGSFNYNLSKPVGMARKLVCIDKQNNWGWKHKMSLEEGIYLAYDYYLNQVK